MNRGSHDQTAASYSEAYNAALPLLRAVYSGPVVIDIPGWGQETSTAASASPLLLDDHLVFSAHIYPQAYNQAAGRFVTPADVQDLFQRAARPCIVGEFGGIAASSSPLFAAPRGRGRGDRGQEEGCDVEAVVRAAKEVGFSAVYGWAWNGDGGGLNMLAPAWASEPTAAEYVETDYFWSILELL